MLDSNGTISSRMMILREAKIITRSGRREAYRISARIVDAPGRGQSGKSAKVVKEGFGMRKQRIRTGRGGKEQNCGAR